MGKYLKSQNLHKLYVKLEILVLLSICLGFKYKKMPAWQLFVSLNDEQSCLYSVAMFQIAKLEGIHKSHFGMIYQSENDKNYKNILFPFKTDAFSNKQGLFKACNFKLALSTPWNDMFVPTNKNQDAERKSKQGNFKLFVNPDEGIKVEEIKEYVRIGTEFAFNRIAKNLMSEALRNKTEDYNNTEDCYSANSGLVAERSVMEDVSNDKSHTFKMDIEERSDISEESKISSHSKSVSKEGPFTIITVTEELLQVSKVLVELMEQVVKEPQQFKEQSQELKRVLNKCFRYKFTVDESILDYSMVLWAHGSVLPPICYGHEESILQLDNKDHMIFNLSFRQYDKIVNNDISRDMELPLSLFIMYLINAYSFNNLCDVFGFTYNHSAEIPQEVRIKTAKVLFTNCYFDDEVDKQKVMNLVIICPEKGELVLISFMTESSLSDEFDCDKILGSVINLKKLQSRIFINERKRSFNDLKNWQTFHFKNHATISLTPFQQFYLALLWIGHQLTIFTTTEFTEEFRKDDKECLFVKSMFDFINIFDQEAANTLLALTLFSEGITYNDDNDDDNNT